MAMDYEKAAGKYRKLIALSQSSEPHEAAAAKRQAAVLKRNYGIDDLSIADQCRDKDPSISCLAFNYRHRKPPEWLSEILHLICDQLGCVTVCNAENRLGIEGDFIDVVFGVAIANELLQGISESRLKYIAQRASIVPARRKDRMQFLRRIRREYERGWAMGGIVSLNKCLRSLLYGHEKREGFPDQAAEESIGFGGVAEYAPTVVIELIYGSAWWDSGDGRMSNFYSAGYHQGLTDSEQIINRVRAIFEASAWEARKA